MPGRHPSAWAFFMSDANTDAIQDAIIEPASVAVEGENIANRSIPDMIAGAKFAASNAALENIVNGSYPFAGYRIKPPGAGGDQC